MKITRPRKILFCHPYWTVKRSMTIENGQIKKNMRTNQMSMSKICTPLYLIGIFFSSENEDSLNESTQPSKKKKSKKEKGTRKNIRKIIDDEKLDERTKEARAAEEERIKRLLQREQRYYTAKISVEFREFYDYFSEFF